MKSAIVITSIFQPTEAVYKFSRLNDYSVIVVGDKKTPSDWNCDNTIFIPVDDKRTAHYKLNEVLPYNHYCRKMLGYLYAIENGAITIVDSDDDNIPKPNWSFPPFEGSFEGIEQDKGFINIYSLFTNQHIWPRGLPLRLITHKESFQLLKNKQVKIGIWQGLADEDPDVDAVYRLTNNQPCYFNERDPLFLSNNTIAPFNTQNTLIRKELFPLMYLPMFVTFRFTDILRGLVAQPIMWLHGYQLGFTDATVVQKRNPHDYYEDFVSELPMYEHCEKVIQLVTAVISTGEPIGNNLYAAYLALNKHGIVTDQEIIALRAWLYDIDCYI
ncbi:MAG: hypothetical protein JWQ84_3689 [Mucilaginibacter sp.]|nr:hypothetical protein [Mucilaginibacter sp.]